MLNIYNANNHGPAAGAPPQPAPQVLPKNGKKPAFIKYEDPTGEFTGKELKWGIWYIQHRLLLYRLLVGFLVAICVVTGLYSLLGWSNYFIFGLTEDANLQADLARSVNYTPIILHYAPAPVQIMGTAVFAGGVNKYDAVAELVNPNDKFFVEFDYSFAVGGTVTPAQHAFLLPGEGRPIAALGLSESAGADLRLENFVWRRVSGHRVPNPAAWQAERLNFTVSDYTFTAAPSAEGANAHALRFKLTNNSAYGYVVPEFLVGLFQNGGLVGVLPLHLENFKSLETRSIDLRSFVMNLNADEVKVFPIINVYDRSVYLAPEE